MILVDTVCAACGRTQIDVSITPGTYPACACGGQTARLWSFRGQMIGDEIPGGVMIAHGLCHEDGTPRRYDSRSAIKTAAAVKGLIPYHDVYVEQGNQRLADARVHADWLQSGEAQRAKAQREEARAEQRDRARRAGVRR